MNRGWIVGIAVLVVASAAAALIVLATGSSMMAEANAYFSRYDFSSPGPVEVDQPEFDRYNVIYARGSTVAALGGPFLLCTLGAACVLLALLAHGYDRRHRRAVQTEAPAAS